jgi:hypothetical protein
MKDNEKEEKSIDSDLSPLKLMKIKLFSKKSMDSPLIHFIQH